MACSNAYFHRLGFLFNLPAYGAQAVYNLKEDFRDKAVDALAGKNIKRAIARGEHLYILALDEDGSATVLIFDTKTSDVLRQLGTEGTSGEYLALSDIAGVPAGMCGNSLPRGTRELRA